MRLASARNAPLLARYFEGGRPRLGAPSAELKVEDGEIISPRGSRTSYWQCAAEAQAAEIPAEPPLKPANAYAVVGKSAARLDLPGKIAGRPSYVHMSIEADKNGKIAGVRVGGEAILAGEGTLYL